MHLLYVMMSSVSNTISSSSKGKRHDLQACIDKKCCRGQSYRRNRHTLTEFSVPELPATKFLRHNSRIIQSSNVGEKKYILFFLTVHIFLPLFLVSSNLIHIINLEKFGIGRKSHNSIWWPIFSAIRWLPRARAKIA